MANSKFKVRNGLYTQNVSLVDSVDSATATMSLEMNANDTLTLVADAGTVLTIKDDVSAADAVAIPGGITSAGFAVPAGTAASVLRADGSNSPIGEAEITAFQDSLKIDEDQVVVTRNITGVSGDGVNVVFTTSTNHSFNQGDLVTITGMDPATYDVVDASITSVTNTTFTISSSNQDVFVSGGIAEITSNFVGEAPIDSNKYVRIDGSWEEFAENNIQISDTTPVSPVIGQLWYDSSEGTPYIYYDDGDSQQWVEMNGTPSVLDTGITTGKSIAMAIVFG